MSEGDKVEIKVRGCAVYDGGEKVAEFAEKSTGRGEPGTKPKKVKAGAAPADAAAVAEPEVTGQQRAAEFADWLRGVHANGRAAQAKCKAGHACDYDRIAVPETIVDWTRFVFCEEHTAAIGRERARIEASRAPTASAPPALA